MVTAAIAAIAVIPKPTSGFCPCPTAKDVMTPAPNPAITSEPSQSLGESLYIAYASDSLLPSKQNERFSLSDSKLPPSDRPISHKAWYCNQPLE
jgi:hypothetical protein